MKPKTIFITAAIVVFAVAVIFALLREVEREEASLANSISGFVDVSQALRMSGRADIERTDRLVFMLVDAITGEAAAMRVETTTSPPQTFSIGQDHARSGQLLQGDFYLLSFTDKDGELYRVSPGEVFGRLPQPLPLGSEQVKLLLDEPYKGQAPRFTHPGDRGGYEQGAVYRPHPLMAAADNPCEGRMSKMIRIEARIRPESAHRIGPEDRLVVKLFIPDQPDMTRIVVIPEFDVPYRFTVGPSVDMSGVPKRKAYHVELTTDRDGDIHTVVPGELVARSTGAVPLGTMDLVLELGESLP